MKIAVADFGVRVRCDMVFGSPEPRENRWRASHRRAFQQEAQKNPGRICIHEEFLQRPDNSC